MEENKKHPSQIIHGFLMADDRKQKEDVPILTHPLVRDWLFLTFLCGFFTLAFGGFGFGKFLCLVADDVYQFHIENQG